MGESLLLLQSSSSPSSSTLSLLPKPQSLSFYQSPNLRFLTTGSHLAGSIRTHRFTGARVVSDYKAPTLNFESTGGGDAEVQADIGGGGDGFGGEGRGGGGGGGGGGDSGGEENKKKNMAMSMSQKFTLGYAALVGVGGLMGYVKTGSTKSLAAGGISAAALGYVYTALPTNPTLASAIGLGISSALLAVMGSRFKRSGKVFPAGVVSAMSLVMCAGYLHGIMRSSTH